MTTPYQIGKDVWLSGTRLKDLGDYLYSKNIHLTMEIAIEIEQGFNFLQQKWCEIPSTDHCTMLLLWCDKTKHKRKPNNV